MKYIARLHTTTHHQQRAATKLQSHILGSYFTVGPRVALVQILCWLRYSYSSSTFTWHSLLPYIPYRSTWQEFNVTVSICMPVCSVKCQSGPSAFKLPDIFTSRHMLLNGRTCTMSVRQRRPFGSTVVACITDNDRSRIMLIWRGYLQFVIVELTLSYAGGNLVNDLWFRSNHDILAYWRTGSNRWGYS